jgi:hypothetical protein
MSLRDNWLKWWSLIEENRQTECPVGVIASRYGLRWPSTQFQDPISLYRTKHPGDLGKIRGVGIVKKHVIIECVRLLAVGGEPYPRWIHKR